MQNTLDFKRATIKNAIESGWLLVFGNAIEDQVPYPLLEEEDAGKNKEGYIE